jgi:hypothetical protein
MRWVVDETCMGFINMKTICKFFFSENLKGRERFEDLGREGV